MLFDVLCVTISKQQQFVRHQFIDNITSTNLALACSGKSFYTCFKVFINLPFDTTFNLNAGSLLSWLFTTLFIPPIHY